MKRARSNSSSSSSSSSSTKIKIRKHNKSGSNSLSLLNYDDQTIKSWAEKINQATYECQGLIQDSPCLLLQASDGRFTVNKIKVSYGYQIVAFEKFGRNQLSQVTSSKISTDLVISHLCGTRNCCNPDHLCLESKTINDERTHCHFCIKNSKNSGGWGSVDLFFKSNACCHKPLCCSLNK
jgi:hypothetical protein